MTTTAFDIVNVAFRLIDEKDAKSAENMQDELEALNFIFTSWDDL